MSGSCRDEVLVVAKAVWLVMQRRDFKNFNRIVEFLELTHDQAPGLICYRHRARLSAGLRGKIVLNMIEDKRPLLDILEALNIHFPPVCPDDSTATTLQAEYGEMFLEALDKLLWEFLYRLQTVLQQEVPRIGEPPRLHREDSVCTPVLPISQSNSDRSVTMMQQDRSYLFRTDSSTEEPHNGLPAWGKAHQNFPEPDSASKGDSYDSDQTIIESEGSQETNLTPIPSDPTCSRTASNQSIAAEKGRAHVFDIFGFDCSESSKVNRVELLSPPNPLQSQEDTGRDVSLELDGARGRVETKASLAKRSSRGGAPPKRHAPPAHEQQNSAPCVSGVQDETRGHLPQGLTSWRFQPKVHLSPLPLDLVRKYIYRHPDSDSTPSSVCSGLSQNSSCTYSVLVESSVTPDDYSNDPDYSPGCDI
ncbi:TERF1-interacting nuclear factor 2 isoform X2 [Aquarana catesbeiana]|uniref:TERF1-interacting nuclear factor 2 isoform X2 n=1 Tax=Aquarana catesbeiana TaxID=8400 RepID=UPI003CC99E09